VQAQPPVVQLLFNNNATDSVASNHATAKKGAGFTNTYYNEPTHSADFNGSAQRFVTPVINLGNEFTICMWVRLSSAGSYPNIVSNWWYNWGFSLWANNSNNTLYFRTSRDGYSSNDAVSTSSAFIDGEWFFVAASINRSAGYAQIYVDNARVTSDSTIRNDFIVNDSIAIGADREGENAMTGQIDKFEIYPYRLSTAQIDSVYDNGATSFYLGAAGGPAPDDPVADTNRVFLHPDNTRYFSYKNEPTVIVTSGEHYGAVLNLDFDYSTYLNTLSTAGLNGTRLCIGANVEYPGWFDISQNTWAPSSGSLITPWARSGTAGYYGGGNRFDLNDWDEDYFDRLKAFLSEAGQHGIIVEIFFFSSIYTDLLWEYSPLKSTNNTNSIGNVTRQNVFNLSNSALTTVQRNMVKKVVTELNDYGNIIWEVCNEPYNQSLSRAWQDSVIMWITSKETELGNSHLISENVENYYQNITGANAATDIFNFHYAYDPSAILDNRDLNLPIGNNETGFSQDDDQYRREAWTLMLNGAAYFNNLDYSFTVSDETGQSIPSGNPGGGGPAIRSQLAFLKTFMDGIDFVNMTPDSSIITSGHPSPGLAYALKKSGEYAVWIWGTSSSISVNVTNGVYQVTFYNTKTGTVISSQNMAASGGSISIALPAYTDDIAVSIALYQESQARVYPRFNGYAKTAKFNGVSKSFYLGVSLVEHEPPPDNDDFNIYNNWDFSSLTVGDPIENSYFGTVYDNYGHSKTEVVNVTINGVSQKALRVYNYGGAQYYPPSDWNYAFEIFADLGADYTEVYISYDWRFSSNWQSTEGGKLSGAGDLPIPPSGVDPVSSSNGWKHRPMFKQAGSIYNYYYDHSGDSYGLSSTYPPYGNNTVFMNPGNWYKIKQRWVINTSGGYDGIYEQYVDNVRTYAQNWKRYYEVPGAGDAIRCFVLSHFYGGSTDEYFPTTTCWGEIANINVYTPKSPVVTGRNLHPTGSDLSTPDALDDQQFEYDNMITTAGTVQNSQYGFTYSAFRDESWMVVATAGQVTNYSYSYNIGSGDYLLIYDGSTTTSTLLRMHTNTSGSSSVASTGTTMFIRFVSDKVGNSSGFTGSITFN